MYNNDEYNDNSNLNGDVNSTSDNNVDKTYYNDIPNDASNDDTQNSSNDSHSTQDNANTTYYKEGQSNADSTYHSGTNSNINSDYSNKTQSSSDSNYYNGTHSSSDSSYYNSAQNSSDNNYYNGAQNNSDNSHYNNQNNDSFYNSNQEYNDNTNKSSKKKHGSIATVLIVTAILLVVSAIAVAVVSLGDSGSGRKSGIETILDKDDDKISNKYEEIGSINTTENTVNNSNGSVYVTDVSGVVEEAMPSVVAITSKTLVESNHYSQDFWEYYFNGNKGGSQTYEQEAAGSGIIIDQTDTELLIVTNNHVVEGSDSLKIQFNGEDTDDAVDGYIKGTDSSADVAVVAVKLEDIPKDTMKNIKKATIGDSDSVKVGEGVIAIGNALGYGQSVTTGVISAKDREAVIEDKTMKLLQTDAAINGGNSGGALLNAKGEVIGINVAKYSSSDSSSASIEGMGFAIPISSVKDIISTLETKETRTKVDEKDKGYLGIVGYDVDEEDSSYYGIPVGICVQNVSDDSPAEEAGIKAYDVITKFDGQTVNSMSALQSLLDYYKAGEKVTITISRNNGNGYAEKELTIKLGSSKVIENMQNN